MKRHVFLVWFGIFLVWAIYRANFFNPDWVDEFIIKPLVFVMPVMVVNFFIERQGLAGLGLSAPIKSLLVDGYIGVVLGVLFAVEGMIVNLVKYQAFTFTPLLELTKSGGISAFLLINVATAISEEILARGYIYNRLFTISRQQFWAAFVSNVLFLLIHIPVIFSRLHLTGFSIIMYPATILVLGFTNCYLYTLRKSIVLPIFLHIFWNMTVALYL